MADTAFSTHPVYPEKSDQSDMVEIRVFGFWLYIMSDLVLFAAIFAAYAVVCHNFAGGPTGKDLFRLPYVYGETMLLLSGSATCGVAMLAMDKGKKKPLVLWLLVTFLLGLGFIFMEIQEFRHMIRDGNGPQRSAFLSAFFTLVGAHGTHVSVGLIWMMVMMGQIMAKGLTLPVQSRLMRLSLFWHFLDVVWIGVFTIVYLTGVM